MHNSSSIVKARGMPRVRFERTVFALRVRRLTAWPPGLAHVKIIIIDLLILRLIGVLLLRTAFCY